jgi:DNA-binding PadR family transcriptional regulator
MTKGTVVQKVRPLNEARLNELLEQWEGNYKKGLLTFWLLFMLDKRPMYAYEVGTELIQVSRASLGADERSIYRALKRFEDLGLVETQWQVSEIGPNRRYFQLTPTGRELLRRFVKRNILLYQDPEIQAQFARLAQTEGK